MNPTPPKGYHVTDEDELLVIPQKVIAMLSVTGYFEMFWHFVQERGYTHVQSWEACERTLEHFKLPGRYSSYESFKSIKSRTEPSGETLVSFW